MSSAPRPTLSVGFHPDRPIAEVGDLAAEAEKLGFHGVWVADSQSLFRDVYAALTVAAMRTSRVELGTGVTNPVSRHPAVIASALGSVDELSGGRLKMGVGTGETAVQSLGRKRATIKRMESTAHLMRGLWAGDAVEYEEATLTQDWRARRVPILFASTGPKSLQAAGRSADGVYLKLGIHPEVMAYALSNVAQGREQSGRTLDGFLVKAMIPVAVDDDDPGRARDEVRGQAGAIARAAALAIPDEDLPPSLAETLAEIERKGSEARGNQGYVEWLHSPEYAASIPDEIVDAFAIAGTSQEVAARINGLGALGITGVIPPLTMPDPWPTLRAIGRGVVPLLDPTTAESA
jgi:5,10-methylenetetrahydromethanopterin reductase